MATVTPRKKRCFVVMGFGIRTDYATGRRIDMDRTYMSLIQPVIKELDLECIRADEIRHTGVIDVPMYRELLNADVVVADLSTSNLNATYELGVRHALRPSTTVVISENKLAYPFDVNHIAITSYALLPGGIDFEEVERFRGVLKDKIKSVLEDPKTDSPVYTYLRLSPPSLQQEIAETLAAGGAAGAVIEPALRASAPLARGVSQLKAPSLAQLTRQGEEAIRNLDFSAARENFEKAIELTRQLQTGPGGEYQLDPYLIQRLVLAIYLSRKDNPVYKLNEAARNPPAAQSPRIERPGDRQTRRRDRETALRERAGHRPLGERTEVLRASLHPAERRQQRHQPGLHDERTRRLSP